MNKSPDNNFTLTILGSGTCVPSKHRSACSFLIEHADQKILFDAGPGTMRRIADAGVSVFDITHIFFSHFHPDHISDLVPLLFANKYPDGSRRKRTLTLCGGTGFLAFYNQLKTIFNEWIDVSGHLDIFEFSNKGLDERPFEGFLINTAPVKHREESVAYKIVLPGDISIVYSGDTDYCEDLIQLSQNVDIFICESALPDQIKVEGHLTPSLAGKIATKANVKKLILTHFYPECDQEDIEAQCRKTYKGPLVLAQDLLKFELEPKQ